MPESKNLSVAFVYDDSLDGNEGVAQYVKTLGAWLSDRGHNVSYFAGQTKADKHHGGKIYSLSKNIRVVFNGNRMSIPLASRSAGIKQALKTAQPDILHVQVPYSPLMGGRVIAKAKLPTIGTFHIFPANWIASFGSKLLRLAYVGQLRKFDEIVSVSRAGAEFAKSAFNLTTVPSSNLVELSAFRSKLKNNPNTIIFLGRLVPRKGCRQLIEAFSVVHQLLPDTKLIIGGNGPQKADLVRLVSKLELNSAVEFKGFIAEEDKADFLAGATIACFPSLYGESFGIVLIEAMGAGAGVTIGGNNAGYRSVLGDKPVLMFDPKNKDELANKLVKLLTEDDLRSELHRWQAKHVKQYDVGVVGHQMEEIYRRAIAKASAKRHNSN